MSAASRLLLCTLLFFSSLSRSFAGDPSITYSYVGGTFTTNDVGAYSGISSNVSGSITFLQQLPPSTSSDEFAAQVSSYSFSDGVQSLTQANSEIVFMFLTTNSWGIPRSWGMDIWKTPVTTTPGGAVAGIRIQFTGTISDDWGFTDGTCLSNGGPGGECDSVNRSGGSNYGRLADNSLQKTGSWTCPSCVSLPIPESQVWTEQTDAASFPDGTAQRTRGAGALSSIVGETDSGNADDRDAYCIRITDPINFQATTDTRYDPAAGADFNSNLLLFRPDGAPVLGNAIAPPNLAPGNAVLVPNANDGSNFFLRQPGEYILVVSGDAEFPYDRDSIGLFDFQPDFDTLRAANPAAGHFDHWAGGGHTGPYTIVLDGAEYCQTDLDAVFANPSQEGKACIGDNRGRLSCEGTTVGPGQFVDVALGTFSVLGIPKLIFPAIGGNQNKQCAKYSNGYFCENVSDDFKSSAAVAIGHVNDDQYPDLVFANIGEANQVCTSDISGTFTCGDAHTDTLASKDVALGFINKDRFLDAIFTNTDARDSVCMGNGSGTFTCDNSKLGLFSQTSEKVALGFVNSDQHLDAIFTYPGNFAEVCLGDGDGNFACTDIPAGEAQNSSGLALGDVNNDGKLDAVFSKPNQNPNVRCLGDGAGGFSCSTINNETITSKAVALGLVNEDANLDAVFANENTPNEVCLGNGSGGFSCSLIDDDFGNTQAVVLGEFWINLLFGSGFEGSGGN